MINGTGSLLERTINRASCKISSQDLHEPVERCQQVSLVNLVDPGFPFRLTPMSFALRVTNSP